MSELGWGKVELPTLAALELPVNFRIDRDSVAAGDDIDSHLELRTFESQMRFEKCIDAIIEDGYLPSISTKPDTFCWSIASARPLAVVSSSGTYFLPHFDADWLIIKDEVVELNFNYHSRVDPETVFEVLLNTRLVSPA